MIGQLIILGYSFHVITLGIIPGFIFLQHFCYEIAALLSGSTHVSVLQ
jgi:hypothetical protein